MQFPEEQLSSLIQPIWLISMPGTALAAGDSPMTMKETAHSHETLSLHALDTEFLASMINELLL